MALDRLNAGPSASTDAVELVSRLLGVPRTQVHLTPRAEVTGEQFECLERWLARRRAGEPVQYITGRAAFLDLDLEVGPAVLVPRPETEGLVEAVIEALRSLERGPRILDLGTGSGAIALAIAHALPEARVVATDQSPAALDVARRNAARLGLAERVEFRRGDWFEALGDERFDVVVSNPPYLSTAEWDDLPDDVRRFEPHEALFSGASGLDALREIVDQAPRYLIAGGLLALELSEHRAAEVAAWLEGAHDFSEVELRDDLSGRPRVLLARRAPGPAIAPMQWREE